VLALAAVVSSLHLLALALGLPAVVLRGRALRAFAGLEKGTAFYLGSGLFWTKMLLFVSVVVLEIHPMVTLIRWRAAVRKKQRPDTSAARKLYVLNHVEMVLVVVIVFVASFMARGFLAGRF
jgi:putative membrane protein